MAYTWKALGKLSDEELIAAHDHKAETTDVGLDFYVREITRREQDRQTGQMLRYTKGVTVMTVIITIATLVNLAATLALLFR